MKIVATTDGKDLGYDVPDDLVIGSVIHLEEFNLEVQEIRLMSNGNKRLGSPNYQMEIQE